MNWERIDATWDQFKGSVKEHWGKLTDEQLDAIAGKREQLAAKIHEVYGIGMEDAEKQVASWKERMKKATAAARGK